MKKSIIYTETANKKIESVLADLKQRIENDITESKNYPGEEIIEITAADIEKTYSRIRILRQYSKISPFGRMTKLIIPTYFILGIIVMIYGLFYNEIQNLIQDDPIRLKYVLVGFIISLTTGAMYFLLKQRENERKKEVLRSNNE